MVKKAEVLFGFWVEMSDLVEMSVYYHELITFSQMKDLCSETCSQEAKSWPTDLEIKFFNTLF